MKTVLSVEESARLIEMGVPESISTFEYCKMDPDEQYPTLFRLDDLLRILPQKITDRRKVYNLTMGVNSEDLWYAKYMNIHNCCDELDSYQDAHELCDCIYDMIVWLKGNPELVWL